MATKPRFIYTATSPENTTLQQQIMEIIDFFVPVVGRIEVLEEASQEGGEDSLGGGGVKNFYKVKKVTSAYTVAIDDDFVLCSGTFTVTLPQAKTMFEAGKTRLVEIKNTSTGTITVATTGSETIDDESTQTLYEDESLTVASDYENYYAVR